MAVLFRQNSFFDGLNRELDEAKIPRSAYPLLISGRSRRDIVAPVNKHLKLDGPEGLYQGIYIAGSYLVMFVDGVGYYADITLEPLVFKQFGGWPELDTTTPRIYAELVTATTNFFNRQKIADTIDIATASQVVFNGTIAGLPQALFVFDGNPANRPNVIFPTGAVRQLKDYGTWTPDNPEYVPNGKFPVVLQNKLFIVSTDGTKIFDSVSGRMSDFVVNLDNEGNKGGDATTVAVSASYNPLTGLRALSGGQLLATTLYGSYTIALDYDHPEFGEPDLIPAPLFPVGCVNDLSTVDVIVNNLQDTAFITQSGIQSFNIVSQLNVESNNLPFGAKINGLLLNPQENTCAVNYDDYSFFAVNTIYGQGVLVYDNVRQNFQSLDLSFRHVKQFAVTKVNGRQRLFFITYTNEVYEAFADTAKETVSIYLGDFTPDSANKDLLISMINVVFSSVRTPGYVKITAYSDKRFVESKTFQIDVTESADANPISFPFTPSKQVATASLELSEKLKGWKLGVTIEWNFDGNLTDMSVEGEIEVSDNVELREQTIIPRQEFAFLTNSLYDFDLNPGGVFVNGIVTVDVVKGQRYVYSQQADKQLVSGGIVLNNGLFVANQDKVVVGGITGNAPSFSLRNAENVESVLSAIRRDKIPTLIGGGDHTRFGTQVDVEMMLMALDLPYHFAPGDKDLLTNKGQYFFAANGTPRYYTKRFNYVEFFFYNANGLVDDPSAEPDGYDINSYQYVWLKGKLAASTAPFKIVVIHEPPYTTGIINYPGYAGIRFPFAQLGASAVLSGHTLAMERIIVEGFPYFVCGTGGEGREAFKPNVPNIASFRYNSTLGFLHIQSDPLACKFTFKDVNLNELDSYTIYS